MTKKQLEKQNEFLLFQLKQIQTCVLKASELGGDEYYKALGRIEYFSSIEILKGSFSHIVEYNLPYNFYDKEVTIDDYKM